MLDKELPKLLAPVVTALGYELVGVERLPQGGHQVLLRVYIDHPEGISLSDCERVSYQVSGVLDVQEPIQGHYTLEVSSPGLERPLFTLDHFIRFVGHKVRVHLTQPLNARRNFIGLLQRVLDRNTIVVVCEETEYSLPYDQIDKAHLVP
ncbi:MAG: ribosome maturation factor RimP [Candidatus Parabeggiatoa sp. nov. 1]|nr:MAG: ribosome maturation factor RimP [Gammaproteobacteria bacterium]